MIAYLASFYGDALFIASLPLLLAALVARLDRAWKWALAFVLVTMCATSKAQLFYLPTLIAVWRFTYPPTQRQASTTRWGAIFWVLMLSQAVTLVPLLANTYSKINYHNAVYTGALLVTDSAALGAVDSVSQECVGIDYWGNKINSPTDVSPLFEGVCRPEVLPSAKLIARLYLHDPSAILKLVWRALPAHSTIFHFHLNQDSPYVQIPATTGMSAWIYVDRARDWLLGGYGLIIVPLVLLVASFALPQRQAMLLSFCGVLSLSQVMVAIMGEGVRDLSRHLFPAQIAAFLGFILLLFFLCRNRTFALVRWPNSLAVRTPQHWPRRLRGRSRIGDRITYP